MMKLTPPDGKGRVDKRKKRSLKATWNVLCHSTFNHFPLILPGVYPLMAPLIMFRLKRRGFSNCRVEVSRNGLIVHAER